MINFESLHGIFGGLRLARRFVTQKRLESLFQTVGGVIVLDAADSEEVEPDSNGTYPQLRTDTKYLVADEQQLQALDDEGTDGQPPAPLYTQEDMMQRLLAMKQARLALIRELYTPRHPHLYTFSEDHLVPELVKAVKDGSKEALLSFLHKETDSGIYSLEVFTLKFCTELIEDVESFENSGLPVMRPNSMNNYGLILDEIGFTPMLDELRTKYVVPFAAILYPHVGGASLDYHHGFIVQYKMREDKKLDFHYDDSEVTLNVCLGKEFEGGSLYFRGLLNDPSTHEENWGYNHRPGKALLHQGKHRHGAKSITSGDRYNFIFWCMSSTYRASLAQQEASDSCCSGDHDDHGHHHHGHHHSH